MPLSIRRPPISPVLFAVVTSAAVLSVPGRALPPATSEVILDVCPTRDDPVKSESIAWKIKYLRQWVNVTYRGCGKFGTDFFPSTESVSQAVVNLGELEKAHYETRDTGYVANAARALLVKDSVSRGIWIARRQSVYTSGKIFYRGDGLSITPTNLFARITNDLPKSGVKLAEMNEILILRTTPLLTALTPADRELAVDLAKLYPNARIGIYNLAAKDGGETGFFLSAGGRPEPVWVKDSPPIERRVQIIEAAAKETRVHLERALARLDQGKLVAADFKSYGVPEDYFRKYLRGGLALSGNVRLGIAAKGADFAECNRSGRTGGAYAATHLYPVEREKKYEPYSSESYRNVGRRTMETVGYTASPNIRVCDYGFLDKPEPSAFSYTLLHELDHFVMTEPDEGRATITAAFAYMLSTSRPVPLDLYGNLNLAPRMANLLKRIQEIFGTEIPAMSDLPPAHTPFTVFRRE